MSDDFLDPINAEEMPNQADAAFALEFLLAAKTGVRNYASAIAETISPEARAVLRNHLAEALTLHGEIAGLMRKNGWFRPCQPYQQFQLDLKSADAVVKIANLQLFPEETSRLGLFATPNK